MRCRIGNVAQRRKVSDQSRGAHAGRNVVQRNGNGKQPDVVACVRLGNKHKIRNPLQYAEPQKGTHNAEAVDYQTAGNAAGNGGNHAVNFADIGNFNLAESHVVVKGISHRSHIGVAHPVKEDKQQNQRPICPAGKIPERIVNGGKQEFLMRLRKEPV